MIISGRLLAATLCLAAGGFLGLAAFPPTVSTASGPEFRLGFKALADQIPAKAGEPVENEHYGDNGDSLQQTTTGLMVWRKADNWTAFTNGSRTWVNGPHGVRERSNEERFDWEAAASPPLAPAPGPVFVDQTPSDYFLVPVETILAAPDGSRLFRCTLANTNHYWTAGEIEVTAVFRDAMGRTIHQSPPLSKSTDLGPLQRDSWDYPIPSGLEWNTASAQVTFRWFSPGTR